MNTVFSLSISSTAKNAILVDCTGHGIPDLLTAVLKLFPLDTYVFNPVIVMDLVNSDKKKNLQVWLSDQKKVFLTVGDLRHQPWPIFAICVATQT